MQEYIRGYLVLNQKLLNKNYNLKVCYENKKLFFSEMEMQRSYSPERNAVS